MIKLVRYKTLHISLWGGRILEFNWGVPWELGFGWARDETTFSVNLPHLVIVLWLSAPPPA